MGGSYFWNSTVCWSCLAVQIIIVNLQLKYSLTGYSHSLFCFSSGADDFNVPRLVLNQFRWLDCIVQSKVSLISSQAWLIFENVYIYICNGCSGSEQE